jgi:carotenoid cleavage dioxygenase-like enzyme
MRTLEPVNPATNPYLSGRFAPVQQEITADDLRVEGALPADLTGAYLRNGPNPRFMPLGSYTYPIEGDGMIHGVWIEGGRARYRNRWVRTQGMLAEERAGHALFGGLLTPNFFDQKLLGPDPDPGYPFKLNPFINIVRHGGRYLALDEGTPPYEVTADLDTVGRYDFAGKLADGICAHPHVDRASGEMVVFRYGFEPPFLSWAVVDREGTVTRPPTIVEGVDRTFMIHDFAITERYVVLVVAPAVFNLQAMSRDAAPLSWQPQLGTRIAVIARDSGATRWLEGDAFWAWHFANGFEDGDEVVLDFPWWQHLALGALVPGEDRGAFTRARLKPGRGTFELTHLDDVPSEFPRIDDRLTGRPHRYLTISRKSGRLAGLQGGEYDELVRYDMRTGTSVSQSPGCVFGEVVFAPRDGGVDELDGYYLTFASNPAGDRSWLLIWDASAFPAEPVARVEIPQRVPNGLHGNWLPAS